MKLRTDEERDAREVFARLREGVRNPEPRPISFPIGPLLALIAAATFAIGAAVLRPGTPESTTDRWAGRPIHLPAGSVEVPSWPANAPVTPSIASIPAPPWHDEHSWWNGMETGGKQYALVGQSVEPAGPMSRQRAIEGFVRTKTALATALGLPLSTRQLRDEAVYAVDTQISSQVASNRRAPFNPPTEPPSTAIEFIGRKSRIGVQYGWSWRVLSGRTDGWPERLREVAVERLRRDADAAWTGIERVRRGDPIRPAPDVYEVTLRWGPRSFQVRVPRAAAAGGRSGPYFDSAMREYAAWIRRVERGGAP